MDRRKTPKLTTHSGKGGRSGASSRLSGFSQNRSRLYSSFGLTSLGTTSKTSLSSMSRKNLASESTTKIIEPLIVENGINMTPKKLLPQGKTTGKKRGGARSKGERTVTESAFQASVFGSGFGTASFNQPTLTLTSSVLDPRSISSFTSATATPSPPRMTPMHEPVEDSRPLVAATISLFSSEDLEKEVIMSLEETETQWMFGLPSMWVDPDSIEAAEVMEANNRYEQVLSRASNGNFSSRGMQTFNNAHKTKALQTETVETQEIGVHASTSDIYDTYQELEDESKRNEDKEDDIFAKFSSMKTKTPGRSPADLYSETTMASSTPQGESMKSSNVLDATTMDLSVLDTGTGTGTEVKSGTVLVEIDPTSPNDHPIMTHPNLMDSLRLMERAILQNVYHTKQTLFRSMIPLRDPDRPPPSKTDHITISASHLDKLWSYGCSLTRKLKVTCMAWNKSNEDILAVGYGSFNAREYCDGLVCCWSIKNPEYPERVFYANAGVSALDFASNYPSLLAAGLLNGSVLLYDIRSTKHDPVLDSREAIYKHLAPVWHLTWVMKEGSLTEDRYAECLVSISMDGNVLEWSIQKGFESCQLMHLKRMITKKDKRTRARAAQLRESKKGGQYQARNSRKKQQQPPKPQIGIGQTYISQHAPGMGLAFWPKDTNVYLACTEEGHVHKCSCSYNEQFLETYEGHTGPIYGATWSPYIEDYFLTCSADWSVKLWHQERNTPIQSFSSAPKAISDVCWSPFNATMFGFVSQGRVEIWDLHHSYLDPIIVHKPLGMANQTCITFAANTKIVIVGDSEGEVSVYMLRNLPSMQEDQKDTLQNAVKAMLKRETKK